MANSKIHPVEKVVQMIGACFFLPEGLREIIDEEPKTVSFLAIFQFFYCCWGSNFVVNDVFDL